MREQPPSNIKYKSGSNQGMTITTMEIQLYMKSLCYINLVVSILNNCFVLVGLGLTIRKLTKVVKKRQYIKLLGEKYGYATCQWKYIEKQLRYTLFLLLLLIEMCYLTLYNIETILQNSYSYQRSAVVYRNDCILSNDTFLAREYDLSAPVVVLRVMKSIQHGLFVYGLWIAFIFMSHISKAMNKLVEHKKLITYSVLGTIGPIFVIVISNIPDISIYKLLITVITNQITLTFAVSRGIKYLILVYKKNKALEYSYRHGSPFMKYKRWLLTQYTIVTITLTILFQIYIFRELTINCYTIGETVIKNPCWLSKTFNLQFSIPTQAKNFLEITSLISKLTSLMLNIVFHAGVFFIQAYAVIIYFYKVFKMKPKRRIQRNNGHCTSSEPVLEKNYEDTS